MKNLKIVALFAAFLLTANACNEGNVSNKNLETTDKQSLYAEKTQYAEGYGEKDFGAVFASDTDEMFPITEEAPPEGVWAELLKLKFKISFDLEIDDVAYRPLFTDEIKKLEGTIIELKGFVIPHDIAATTIDISDDGQRFMFSAFPLAQCFFCGGAGAESVVEVFPKNPIPYSKQKIILRGKLKFNRTDFLKLPYILEDAEWIESEL